MKPFNAKSWEVRAWLDGRKTQFRRVNKLATKKSWRLTRMQSGYPDGARPIWGDDDEPNLCSQKCPYVVGQRLWVRETFRIYDSFIECACYDDCRCAKMNGKPVYRASEPEPEHNKWHPSIHMPRWASRLTLEITAVRVERLQDISEEDCWLEGIDRSTESPTQASTQFSDYAHPRRAFSLLWESTYGPGSWDANPWVWVVETEVVT